MLEKPDIQDEEIVSCLREEYNIPVERVIFLPLGADVNTAVFRLKTAEQGDYFLKSNFLPNATIDIARRMDKT